MSSLRPLVAIILLALIAGCGSDDSTSPPPPAPPLATADVGPEGGVVDADVVVVEIPAGVLEETSTVGIHRLDDDDPVGSGQPVYAISGLPANRNASFTVSLQAEESMTAAVGEYVQPTSEGALRWVYRRWPSELVDDRLELELPRNDLPATKDDTLDDDEIRITTMVGDGDLISPNDQFLIRYDPAEVTFAQAADVAAKFEAALATYTGRGWAYPGPSRVAVDLRNFNDTDQYGFWSPSKLGNSYCSFEINSQYLDDPTNLMATIGHETLHMVQHYYDPRWSFFKAISGGPQYWFDEATAVWAEELFLGEDHVSDVRVDLEHHPLLGLPPDTESDHWTPRDYGYGMSALIKEIVARNGGSESQIIACYEELLDENVDTPTAAIMAHVTGLDDWYDDYLIEYVSGGPYGDYNVSVATLGRAGSVQATPGELTDESFGHQYRDRRGRLYRVRFDNAAWDPSVSLVVSTRSRDERPVPVSIYRRVPAAEGPDMLDFIARGTDQASYLRFGNSIEPGSELFVLVFAAAEDSITTRFRVSELEDVEAVNNGGLSTLDFSATWGDGSTTEEELGFGGHPGVFTGQSFTSSWTRNLGGGKTAAGQLTLVFDPISLDIETWAVQETRWYADGSPLLSITATGGNVHRDAYGEPGVLYYSTATQYAMDTCTLWRDGLGSATSWEGSIYTSFVILLYP